MCVCVCVTSFCIKLNSFFISEKCILMFNIFQISMITKLVNGFKRIFITYVILFL